MMRKRSLASMCCLLSILVWLPAYTDEVAVNPASCPADPMESSPLWQTGGTCDAAFCSDDQQCWSYCPDAVSVACVSGVCQYTLPGPGPSPGNCPNQAFCWDDSQCDFGTVQGTCIGGVCHC